MSYYHYRNIRSFTATLGPAGGKRGYAGITGHVSNGLAWYMNGLLIPELWLRRGLTYSFKVSVEIGLLNLVIIFVQNVEFNENLFMNLGKRWQ